MRSMTQQQLLRFSGLPRTFSMIKILFQYQPRFSKMFSGFKSPQSCIYLKRPLPRARNDRRSCCFFRILEQLTTAVSKFQTHRKMPRNCIEAQNGEHNHQNLPYALLSNFMLKWIATWKGKGSFPSPSSRLRGKR